MGNIVDTSGSESAGILVTTASEEGKEEAEGLGCADVSVQAEPEETTEAEEEPDDRKSEAE